MRFISSVKIPAGITALSLLVCLLLTGIQPISAENYDEKVEKDQETELIIPIRVGDIPPDFTVMDMDGNEFALSAMVGQMPVVIDFWATWCGPCIKGIPHLLELDEKYGDKVMVVGVGVWMDETDIDEILQFVEDNEIGYRIIHNVGSDIAGDYSVQGIPYMVVIGIDGVVIGTHLGYDPNIIVELSEELGFDMEPVEEQ